MRSLPRGKRKTPEHVKRAAERAEKRSAGADPLEAPSPIDPPIVPAGELMKAKRGPKGPHKYKREFAKQARKLCSLGATDRDLAEFFCVDTSTIWQWQVSHKEFSSALKVHKSEFDDRVARALAQRAVGYSYDSVKFHAYEGDVTQTPCVEHVPPDPGAAKLWLCNRRPEEWRDKNETTHKLDASEAFLKVVQHISARANPKLIEGKAT